jgi:hypothetical protein
VFLEFVALIIPNVKGRASRRSGIVSASSSFSERRASRALIPRYQNAPVKKFAFLENFLTQFGDLM